MTELYVPPERALVVLHHEFVPDVTEPTLFFKEVSKASDAIFRLDSALLVAFDGIQPEYRLHAVDAGSLRTTLARIVHWSLSLINEEALRKGEIKAIIGNVLADMRAKALDWAAEVRVLEDRRQAQPLLAGLDQAAKQLGLTGRTPFALLPIIKATQSLTQARGDGLTIEEGERHRAVPLPIDFGGKEPEEILSAQEITTENERILLVKRPDYLSDTQWEFRASNRVIRAPIEDRDWLEKFQAAQVRLHPGDALRVVVREHIYLDDSGKETSSKAVVLKVLQVVSISGSYQQLPLIGDTE